MNLTRAAITAIVSDLQAAGLVREIESHYPSGRRPIVLEINPDRGYVVGIDMGATHVTILVTDFSARVVREMDEPLDINQGPAVCLPRVESLVHQILSEAGLSIKDISAVGAGVPGPVVAGVGVMGPPIMPGWDGYPIRDDLEKRFGVPVSLSNDAELGAIGEWAYGAGRGERDLAYIKVGTGIGAGLLLDGQIYRGATGSSGEIGHITIEENGPVCTCGNRGCLEALAGGRAIANRAIQEVNSGRRTVLTEISPVSQIRSRDVIAAARRGDLVSQQIVSEAGVHLGTALASLVNLFNPSMVVVGGGVAQIGDLLLEPIRETVHQRSLLPASRSVRITSALLGRRSSAMGAVVQALSIVLHRLSEHS
ncbi:ROK family protein [Longilinea arvoryzae]|nr:ROK family protein [Longilinea arvoryzae]